MEKIRHNIRYNVIFKFLDYTFGNELTIFPVQLPQDVGDLRVYKYDLKINGNKTHAIIYFKTDLNVYGVVHYSSRIASLFHYWFDIPGSIEVNTILKEWVKTKKLNLRSDITWNDYINYN